MMHPMVQQTGPSLMLPLPQRGRGRMAACIWRSATEHIYVFVCAELYKLHVGAELPKLHVYAELPTLHVCAECVSEEVLPVNMFVHMS